MDKEQQSSVGRQSQGAGNAGTPHNSLFASRIYFHLSFRHLCLDPEGKGDGDAVFSAVEKN